MRFRDAWSATADKLLLSIRLQLRLAKAHAEQRWTNITPKIIVVSYSSASIHSRSCLLLKETRKKGSQIREEDQRIEKKGLCRN